MSRRFDLCRPTLFFRMTDCFFEGQFKWIVHEFGECDWSCCCFDLHFLEGRERWMRRSGGIRQRAHPQWLRQRRQNLHATHCAQGRVQSQMDWASSQPPPSRARAGVRLQPAPAAAPSDQPYHPDASRLVCRSRSGPVASRDTFQSSRLSSRDPDCFGTDRSL